MLLMFSRSAVISVIPIFLNLLRLGARLELMYRLVGHLLLSKAVSDHQLFPPWPTNDTRELRYRKTDLFVIDKTGYHPLSVSTDRIGVASMRVRRKKRSVCLRERHPTVNLSACVLVYAHSVIRKGTG